MGWEKIQCRYFVVKCDEESDAKPLNTENVLLGGLTSVLGSGC